MHNKIRKRKRLHNKKGKERGNKNLRSTYGEKQRKYALKVSVAVEMTPLGGQLE